MQPHQQRVVTEKEELDEKIFLLTSFISGSDIFKSLDSEERERMFRQLGIMNQYSSVLEERIEAFKD